MGPSISVIMSAYNTEAYISKAIESILRQTFTDFEFLIVDNGSADGTGTIIDSYSVQDKRITVIRNESNIAPSEALNRAMEMAVGKYLYVLDSDDWVVPDLLQTMFDRAARHNAQFVYCGFYMDYISPKKTHSFSVYPTDADYSQSEFREKAIEDVTRMILGVYWNKLVRLEYLKEKNIRFRNTKMFDYHFNMDILMDIERVSAVGKPLYHYIRARSGSYMNSNPALNQKKRDHFAHTIEVYGHWGISDRATTEKLAGYHLAQLIRCVIDTVNGDGSKEYKKKELKTIFNDQWTIFVLENRPKDLKTTVFALPLRSKSYMLCRIFGWMADCFQRFMPEAYYTLRAAVAQNAKELKLEGRTTGGYGR